MKRIDRRCGGRPRHQLSPAPRLLLLLSALLLQLPIQPPAPVQSSPLPDPCPPEQAAHPLPPPLPEGTSPAPGSPAGTGTAPDSYRHRLRSTPHGWARRDHWCVWVEPGSSEGPAARWDRRWSDAVQAALAEWSGLLPLTQVDEPERAQVRVLRRRPPLRGGRASHGRAELALRQVQRGGLWRLEPLVVVHVSPDQRQEATQATALHELGHAFGLWGHSDDPGDAMAGVPGPVPVLRLSERDRTTLRWLQRQPELSPEHPPDGETPQGLSGTPAVEGSPHRDPTAD
ncbi:MULTISPECIES: hypothetical protein [Aphanothece]|uniref:hypothetical protein n=1 Tax=Aphanothece TaxID=1121 RepID=UPI0039855F19